MTSECQAHPEAWSDWGGFVDTHDQNGSNDTHGTKIVKKENEVKNRVLLKVQMFLNNIENDIKKSVNEDFDTLKKQFSSKYKNLPVKFHSSLDEVLKWKSRSPVK